LLRETIRGINILEHQENYRDLSDSLREDLINVIIEEVLANDITIKTNEFECPGMVICALRGKLGK